MSGGNPLTVATYGLSTVNIFGNVSISSWCYAYNSSVVKVSSHNANLNLVYLWEHSTVDLLAGGLTYAQVNQSATVNVTGGSLIELETNDPGGNSRINISGGTTNDIDIYGSSVVRFSGGVISRLWIWEWLSSTPDFDAEIQIVGYGLSAIPYDGAYGSGQATGFWNNDVNFSIPFENRGVYSYITLYDGVIPADCVNRPDSDLDGDCKVNFFDFSEMASEWLNCGLDDPNAC